MIQINFSLDQESVNLLVEGEIELCHFPESKVSNKKSVFLEKIKNDVQVVMVRVTRSSIKPNLT